MGLDVYLVRQRDYEDGSWVFNGELCYGRKIWKTTNYILSHPLCKELEEDSAYLISEEVWDNFYRTFNKYKYRLKFYGNLISRYESIETVSKIQEKILLFAYNRLHSILDPILKPGGSRILSGYELGVDWEARAIYRWLCCNKKIQNIFDERENLVLILDY